MTDPPPSAAGEHQLQLSHPVCRYTVLSGGLPDDACMDRERAQVIMDRLYNMDTTYTIQDFFSGWFMGADPADISHDNLLDFTAYGFFGARLKDLSPQVSASSAEQHLM